MANRSKRKNIYFRQTAKEFRAQKINKIIQHFRTNIPYKIYSLSKKGVKYPVNKIRSVYNTFSKKLPKDATREKDK